MASRWRGKRRVLFLDVRPVSPFERGGSGSSGASDSIIIIII